MFLSESGFNKHQPGPETTPGGPAVCVNSGLAQLVQDEKWERSAGDSKRHTSKKEQQRHQQWGASIIQGDGQV